MARAAILFAALGSLCISVFAQTPSDEEIRKILSARVGSETSGIGIVVGIVDANGRRIVSYGSLAKNDSRRLGDMVRRGEVALTDPVSKFLPASQSAGTKWSQDHACRSLYAKFWASSHVG